MTEPSEPPEQETRWPWWAASTGKWTDRVAYSKREAFSYRPHEVLAYGLEARDRAMALVGDVSGDDAPPDGEELPFGYFLVTTSTVDALEIVAELRHEGHRAKPNYVLFADQTSSDQQPGGSPSGAVYANPVYANPVYANPVYANPVYANPVYANGPYASTVYANPVYASPVYANPVYANPVYANVYKRTGRRTSSARPADAPSAPRLAGPAGPARVIVLDTGLAVGDERPHLLERLPAGEPYDAEHPDEEGDGFLDPCAGHGTYEAGILELLVPGVTMAVGRVLSTFGDGDEARIGTHIDEIRRHGIGGIRFDEYSILNLSFGGYAAEDMAFLAHVLRRVQRDGVVVVASAGNDATWRPSYPAYLPDVVGVGALGTDGPAPFTNYGPWVSACAPGVDLVSTFFERFKGSLQPLPGSPDPDNFEGWARWSGTSFSAPIVAGVLAREINTTGCTAKQAVERLIDAPGLFHLPGLGTVINVLWPGAEPAP